MANGLPPYTVTESRSHPSVSNHNYAYNDNKSNSNYAYTSDGYNYAYVYPDPYAYAYTYPTLTPPPPAPPVRTTSLHADPQSAQRPSAPLSTQRPLSQGPSAAPRYSSTAEAIAHFRPTPREVISGIAPHVFDERRRRRQAHGHGYGHRKSQSAAAGYGASGYMGVGAYGGNGAACSGEAQGGSNGGYVHARRMSGSPLKGGAVIAWDERGVYVEETHPHSHSHSHSGHGNEKDDMETEDAKTDDSDKRKRKRGWRYLVRVDVRLFRTMVDKLRPNKATSAGADAKR